MYARDYIFNGIAFLRAMLLLLLSENIDIFVRLRSIFLCANSFDHINSTQLTHTLAHIRVRARQHLGVVETIADSFHMPIIVDTNTLVRVRVCTADQSVAIACVRRVRYEQ